MGNRGPKSSAPGGYGTITPKGYRHLYDAKRKKRRLEHCLVWENHFGPIPNGMQIHHINQIKLDNRIDNLILVTVKEHKREHAQYQLINGSWWKPCTLCKVLKNVEIDYYKYKTRGRYFPRCKICESKIKSNRYKSISLNK